jgi:iron donor protein CyaY
LCKLSQQLLYRIIDAMDERVFQQHAEQAMERLKRSLYAVEEAAGFEVEERGGALHLNFDEPPGTFVISPNSAARQLWISALSTSFKLDWDDAFDDFALRSSGEPLPMLMARLLTEQTGNAVSLD